MRLHRSLLPFLGWASSLAIHAAVMVWLVAMGDNGQKKPPHAVVSLSVVGPELPTRAAPSPAPPKPVLPNITKAVKLPPRAATPVSAAPAIAKPAETQPIDMSGVTLTAGDGASWSSMTGNGQTMTGPIQPSVSASSKTTNEPAIAKRSVVTVADNEPIRLRDLADKPIPPVLNAKLRANYPPEAKRQGISGSARVLARVDADGWVRQVSTAFESSEGFGAACRQTLLGSRWSTPRDKAGRPVPTQVHYTCQFRVDGS